MNKGLPAEILDLLHWKEYTFIGQDNAVFEGSLTQASEERIVTSILAKVREVVGGTRLTKREFLEDVCSICAMEERWTDEDCKICQSTMTMTARAQLQKAKDAIEVGG